MVTVRRKKVLFRVAACVVGSLVAGVSGWWLWNEFQPEIFFEDPNHAYTGIRMVYDEELGWRNVPDTRGSSFGHPLTINALGHRDPDEYTVERPDGTKRILILGDSFCWGFGVGDEHVFAELLENDLVERNHRFEVINSGVVGWSTDQEYLYLKREGMALSPEVVILVLYVNNDIPDNTLSKHGPPLFVQKPMYANLDLELSNVPVPKPSEDAPRRDFEGDSLDLATAIIRKMAEVCEQGGVEFLLVKYADYWGGDYVEVKKLSEGLAERLQNVPHCRYHDLNSYFEERGLSGFSILEETGHWNPLGHREVADFLMDVLVDEGVIADQ